MTFHEKNGEIIMIGDHIDFKIDTNRKVYAKKKNTDRYKYIEHQIPHKWNVAQKQDHLRLLHDIVAKRLGLMDTE